MLRAMPQGLKKVRKQVNHYPETIIPRRQPPQRNEPYSFACSLLNFVSNLVGLIVPPEVESQADKRWLPECPHFMGHRHRDFAHHAEQPAHRHENLPVLAGIGGCPVWWCRLTIVAVYCRVRCGREDLG
jgi:hypothetical protein